MKKLFFFSGILILAASSFAQIDFIQHDITTNFPLALYAYPEDIDGDGDMDFVGTSAQNNEVSWWENDGSQDFTQHFVSNNLGWGRTVIAVDIDDDEDIDFLGAGWNPGIIIWWENDGDQSFSEFVIDNTFSGAHTVAIGDMDNDGDIDVLCSAYRTSSGEIAWWENDGNENFITKHTINDMSDRNACVYAIDVNNDGHMDVVGCGYGQGDVSWWENNGEQEFTEHVIGTDFAGAHWIHAEDIDGDGDNDIVGAAYIAGKVTWWENLGDETFNEHLIDNTWNGTAWVFINDLDNDNDKDIIAVAEISDAILLWENDGNENFTVDPVVTSYSGAFSAYPADMDNDYDMDILASASSSNRISWFESNQYRVIFEANPFSGHAPLEVQFTDLSNFIEPVISWSWDFDNDGVIDSNTENPVWIYEEPDTYSVSLEVSTDTFTRTLLKEDYITVFAGESGLFFDGSDSYVLCPSSPSLNLTEAFTIEAWINPIGWGENSAFGFGRIIDKQRFLFLLTDSNPVLNDYSICLWLFHEDGSNSRSVAPDNSISLNSWQHVAVTYDGISEVKIYVYGQEQSLTQTAPPAGNILDNSANDFIIGNSIGQSYTFEGTIDELRIWNVVRDEQQINDYMFQYLSGNEQGLVGCWRMNEANGETIIDFTSNANDGTLYDTSWITGAPMIMTSTDDLLSNDLSSRLVLYPNFPNPFNPSTTISYQLPKNSKVELTIYNLKGQKVQTLTNEFKDKGNHTVTWEGDDELGNPVTSGIYFYKLKADDFQKVKKMILMK